MSFINKVLNMLPDFEFKSEEGNTILHQAVLDNDVDMVSMLIEKMKDSNKNIINYQNNDGNTAFHLSLINNNNLISQLLDSAGADKTIRNNKGEYVEDITEEEHKEIVNFQFNEPKCSKPDLELIGVLQALSKLSNSKPIIIEADIDTDIEPTNNFDADSQLFLKYDPRSNVYSSIIN